MTMITKKKRKIFKRFPTYDRPSGPDDEYISYKNYKIDLRGYLIWTGTEWELSKRGKELQANITK